MTEHNLANMLRDTAERFKGGFGNWVPLYHKGHPGVIAPFTKEEKAELKRLLGKQMCRQGFCYQNAQNFAMRAMDDPRVKYIEGLVTVHDVPISHAWIEFNGKVFDPTLYNSRFKQKQVRPESEYYGMEVPKNLIPRNQLQMRTYSPLTEWPSKFAEELLYDKPLAKVAEKGKIE